MHEHYLDRIIKEKLQSLEVLFDPTDWDRMEEILTAAFDAFIAEKLSSLAVAYNEADWPVLAKSLDEVFDAQIRESFEGLTIEPGPTDWSLIAAALSGESLDSTILSELDKYEEVGAEEDWKMMSAILDESPVDTAVREKLGEASVPFEAADWTVFEAKLNQNFDELIESKVAGHEVEFIPADWNKMATQLDGGPFDTSVRELIGTYAVPFALSDWSLMEEKLNEPFYHTVQDKLVQHEAPYSRKDWRRMASLLHGTPEKGVYPWYANWRNYLSAASVVAILLLSFFWLSQNTMLNRGERNFAEYVRANPNTESLLTEESSSETGIVSNADKSKEVFAQATLNNEFAANVMQEEASETPYILRPGVRKATPTNIKLADSKVTPAPTVIANLNQEEVEKEKKSDKQKIKLNRLKWAIKPMYARDLSSPWRTKFDSHKKGVHKTSLLSKRKRADFRFGIYAATSNTKVELSAPAESKDHVLETFVLGTRFDFKIRKSWSIVSGINYEERSFGHKYRITVPGGVSDAGDPLPDTEREQAIDARLKLLEAPLMVRYDFPSSSAVNLYAQAGVVTMISLKEDYYFYDENSPNNQNRDAASVKGLDPRNQTWSLNTYPGNIHVAAGLEYAMSNHVALQIEPYFQLSLQRTRGSGSLGFEKRMYTSGLSLSLLYGRGGKKVK